MTSSQINKNALSTYTLSQPGTAGGPAFTMSSTCWLSLQTFAGDVAQLPTTTTQLSAAMGSGAPTDMSDFTKLVNLYSEMNATCYAFCGAGNTSSTYDSIVTLADNIYNYAQSVPTFYGGLQTEITALQTATPATQPGIVANIQAILTQLEQAIAPYITGATTESAAISTFSSTLLGYNTTLGNTGSTDPATMWGYYNNEYGTQSTAVENIQSQLTADAAALQQYKDDYHHDVVCAATSPTYAWVAFPVGLIAASIVSGVFGAKATAALNSIHATEATIATLTAEEAADNALMTDLTHVTTQISSIDTELNSAISTVEGILGSWNALSSDLSNINTGLTTDFTSTLAFLLQLDFNNIINDWTALATAANSFRVNAYITVNP